MKTLKVSVSFDKELQAIGFKNDSFIASMSNNRDLFNLDNNSDSLLIDDLRVEFEVEASADKAVCSFSLSQLLLEWDSENLFQYNGQRKIANFGFEVEAEQDDEMDTNDTLRILHEVCHSQVLDFVDFIREKYRGAGWDNV